MRNRVVIYSVAGLVAMSLIAAAAFKSQHPASDPVTVSAPAVSAPHPVAARRTLAKTMHPIAKPAATVEADIATGTLPKSYRVLFMHSLFSSQPTSIAGASVTPAEGEFTLRGVVKRDRKCTAYIENVASHQSQEFRVGDAVGVGKLVAIDLDGVRYAASGRDMRVEVGQSFNGARKIANAQSSTMSTLRQITE